MNQLLSMCGIVGALFLGGTTVFAQDNSNNDGGNGGRRGGGNFDPAQFQQRIMDNVREQLGFTNDTDWNSVQPLVQKVMNARRDLGNGGMGMRMMFGRNRGGNNNGDNANNGGNRRGGGFFGQPSPEAQALRSAIESNAPTDQIKSLLDKYQASQKAKQDALKQAQENLRAALSVKQQARAALLGLLD